MKKVPLLILLFSLFALSGCATVMTGMPASLYKGAPVALAYSDAEILRDQAGVATIIVPKDRYGVSIDGIPIKERDGAFNPDIRVSESDNAYVFFVDLLPGSRKLTVTYNAMTGHDGKAPPAKAGQRVGKATVSGSYSGPSLFSWIRTSDTVHDLKGGEIYVIGLKMMSVSGDIDLYPLDEGDREIVIETRNNAQFADSAGTEPVQAQ